jgi:hypothetical protein
MARRKANKKRSEAMKKNRKYTIDVDRRIVLFSTYLYPGFLGFVLKSKKYDDKHLLLKVAKLNPDYSVNLRHEIKDIIVEIEKIKVLWQGEAKEAREKLDKIFRSVEDVTYKEKAEARRKMMKRLNDLYCPKCGKRRVSITYPTYNTACLHCKICDYDITRVFITEIPLIREFLERNKDKKDKKCF